MDSVMYMDGDTRRVVCRTWSVWTVLCTWMVIHRGYMDSDTRRVVCGQCHGWCTWMVIHGG